MRTYRFDIGTIIEAMGYKRAVKEFQSTPEGKGLKEVTVQWKTKRGKDVTKVQSLPMKTRSRW
tara:strand:+ start:37 stop:225 length:189 start_codon:yes stop_codon:yes gene_type:complete